MTTEDAGLNVDAENKVTVRGAEVFTLADLRVAARELAARGVPADAPLNVNMNMTGTRWSVTARWEPAPGIKLPEDTTPPGLRVEDPEPDNVPAPPWPAVETGAEDYTPPEFCGKCGKTMRRDESYPSGWTHLDKLADKHPAVKGRPVRDTPQA